MTDDRTVGFIGLGAMGGPMAANLARRQWRVRGFDLSGTALKQLEADGGTAVASPGDAAKDSAVTVLMVATAEQAETALFGERGAAPALVAGSTVVLHATVPPAYAEDLGARLQALGLNLLDAPVSGGRVGAEAGRLTIMASGNATAFGAADPVLEGYAGKVYRLGDKPGAGSTVKMVNQLLAGVHIVSAAEAMALGTRVGADPRMLFEIISNSAGNSWMFGDRVPHMLDGDYTPRSAVEIFVKDLGIVLETAKDARFPLPLTAAAFQQFLAAAAAGLGREDDAAVVKVYEQLAGISVASPVGE